MPLLTTGAGKFPSGGGGSSHTYWRLEFDGAVDNNGAQLMHFDEVEFLVGGVDQATGGTATASSELSGSFVAANAFADDGPTTTWASDASNTWPQWIQYQFTSPVLPDAISITPDTQDRTPENITVKFSDNGSSFTTYTVVNTGALSDWGGGFKRTFSIP